MLTRINHIRTKGQAMTQMFQEPEQEAFASAVAQQLRDARVRQKLTQSQLADLTGGRVSKAALANYETRQRSLRIDVFWVLVRALGEDPAALLAAAERESGFGISAEAAPMTIDIESVRNSDDARLRPVKRWFALRAPHTAQTLGSRAPATVTLDDTAITALAQLMGTTPSECRGVLLSSVAATAAPVTGLASAG